MKPRKTFYFNEGIDGIVCTSSRQRALKMYAEIYRKTLEEVKARVKVKEVKTTFKRGWVGWLFK